MKERYNALFDKLAPVRSDDELLQAVLDRKAEKMKHSNHFLRKAIIIPVAAVSLALCTTVGVSAAYDWNIPAAIADIFGKNSDKIPEGVSFKDFNFTTVGGRELSDTFAFNGGEIALKGVAADPHSVMLFYDVTFESEVSEETREKLGGLYFVADLSLYVDYRRNLAAAGTDDDPVISKEYSWKHIDMKHRQQTLYLGSEGNTAHYCIKEATSGASLAGRSVTLEVGRLSIDENGEVTYGANDTTREYTLDLSFVEDSGCVDIYEDHEIALSSGVKGNVSHIQVTPFSVGFRVLWDEQRVEAPDENGNVSAGALDVNTIFDEFKIKLKDGTILDETAFRPFVDVENRTFKSQTNDAGVEVYAQDAIFEWLYPVEVSEVEALMIGTTTVPIG